MKNSSCIVSSIFFSFLFSLFSLLAAAQSLTPNVVASQGDYVTSAGGSLSWTLGEISGETYSSATNFLTQGFQQPDTVYVTAVSNPVEQTISVYPNPVIDNLMINFSVSGENYFAEVFDMTGRMLTRKYISSAQTKISFSPFSEGIYLLTISNAETHITYSFKIHKLK
ncbi:MAG: T9SS type A sorting domain-containing protein [Bacteroidetes bacterium]|nr:T9SS type A sorting domain-containing protein [Bacteroidota bacterium]